MSESQKKRRAEGATAVTRYEVFGRKNSREHLCHVGTVSAPNRELAIVRAVMTFDEYQWLEFCVVPQGAVIPIKGPDERTRMWVA